MLAALCRSQSVRLKAFSMDTQSEQPEMTEALYASLIKPSYPAEVSGRSKVDVKHHANLICALVHLPSFHPSFTTALPLDPAAFSLGDLGN